MTIFCRRNMIRTARLALCVAALWLVSRNLTIQDTLVLQDGTVLSGAVLDRGAAVWIEPAGEVTRSVARTEIARDPHGVEQIRYGLASVWGGSAKGLLAAGVLVFLAVPVLQAVRLQYLLRWHAIRLTSWESLRLALAGNFLNFAAPLGSTAGDVYKAWYVAQRTPLGAEAATLVFLDRAIGLGTLLLSVGVIAAFCPIESRLAPLRGYLLGLCALLIGGALLYVMPWIRNGALIRRLKERLAHDGRISRIDRTARALLASPRRLAVAMLITLVLQTFAALAFACVGLAVGLRLAEASVLDVYAHFSTGEIVKAIPGPPQGLGTMELAYGYFFNGLGSMAQIVSAAVAIRLVNLICALPGAWAVMSGTARTPRPAAARELSPTVPATV